MKKNIVFFAAIAAAISLAASCSYKAEEVKTLVDEGNGQAIAVVVEYNTPISYLSVKRESFEVPGYRIVTALTTEKFPENQLIGGKKKAAPAPERQSEGKIQVVPRQGQNLNGEEAVRPKIDPKKDLMKDSLKGKDGKYVLLLVRKKRMREVPAAPADSTASKQIPVPESQEIIVRQVSDIKTVKGKTVAAWKDGMASSESIKIKMQSRYGMPGGVHPVRRPDNVPQRMPAAPSAPVKK